MLDNSNEAIVPLKISAGYYVASRISIEWDKMGSQASTDARTNNTGMDHRQA